MKAPSCDSYILPQKLFSFTDNYSNTQGNIDEIIKQVAKVHNTTPEEVYAEMQIALDAAFQSKDPEVQKEWAKIPFKGDHPTPEDVIPYLVGQLKNPQVAVS